MSSPFKPARILAVSLAGFALVALGLVAFDAGSTASAATAPPRGTMHGIVSSGGVPLGHQQVDLLMAENGGDSWDIKDTATTAPDGSYEFSNTALSFDPNDDIYYVRVTDPEGSYVRKQQHAPMRAGTTTTLNISTVAAGYLTGSATLAGGGDPTTVHAEISGPPDFIGNPDETDGDTTIPSYVLTHYLGTDGRYRFTGLPAGSYKIRFTDTSGSHVETTVDGLDVAAGEVTTVPNTELAEGARIAGTVVDGNGKPVAYAQVTAFADGSTTPLYASRGWTGAFTTIGMPGGSYQLRIEQSSAAFATTWYRGKATSDEATVITLAAGEELTDLKPILRSKSTIKATAKAGTGKATITVVVTRTQTGGHPSGTVTATAGSHTTSAELANGDGKAKLVLTGLKKGKQTVTVDFAGTGATAPSTKKVSVTVK